MLKPRFSDGLVFDPYFCSTNPQVDLLFPFIYNSVNLKQKTKTKLILKDGTVYSGFSFGHSSSTSGEVVFNTGMVGYVESLTDPSYAGQILVLTYPLIGNYGVPKQNRFESKKIQVQGLVVSEYSRHYSHSEAKRSLEEWLRKERIPAIYDIDTRDLTKRLRTKGVMLGAITQSRFRSDFFDPNKENMVARVSILRPQVYGEKKTRGRHQKKILLIDCGMKENILRLFLDRGIAVKRVPWNYTTHDEDIDGVFISNGPGDPKHCAATVAYIKQVMKRNLPIFGICLGAQLLARAVGAKTYKLKYGHRAQNQPVLDKDTNRCYITSQNHGYAIRTSTLPKEWDVWFINLNDDTVEGIKHKEKPWFAVQFHPEAAPGPTDTEWLIDEFVRKL